MHGFNSIFRDKVGFCIIFQLLSGKLDITQPGALAYDRYVTNVLFLHTDNICCLNFSSALRHVFNFSFYTAGVECYYLVQDDQP